MSVLHRGSASLSPQDRDADELPLTHQIRWTLLASSQEHKMNQSAFFKQKSPARRNSGNKQSSGESWAWRLSRNIIKWIRKANGELEGERGRNLCINLPCHCGVCPLSGTWITVLLSSKAMIKPPFMHWCRVWPCMAIYDFKCTGQLVLPVSVRQEISPGPLWVETEKQRSDFLQVTKYILGRAGRGSENCRMQKSQFWAQPMHEQITVFNGCCQPRWQRVLGSAVFVSWQFLSQAPCIDSPGSRRTISGPWWDTQTRSAALWLRERRVKPLQWSRSSHAKWPQLPECRQCKKAPYVC